MIQEIDQKQNRTSVGNLMLINGVVNTFADDVTHNHISIMCRFVIKSIEKSLEEVDQMSCRMSIGILSDLAHCGKKMSSFLNQAMPALLKVIEN